MSKLHFKRTGQKTRHCEVLSPSPLKKARCMLNMLVTMFLTLQLNLSKTYLGNSGKMMVRNRGIFSK